MSNLVLVEKIAMTAEKHRVRLKVLSDEMDRLEKLSNLPGLTQLRAWVKALDAADDGLRIIVDIADDRLFGYESSLVAPSETQ